MKKFYGVDSNFGSTITPILDSSYNLIFAEDMTKQEYYDFIAKNMKSGGVTLVNVEEQGPSLGVYNNTIVMCGYNASTDVLVFTTITVNINNNVIAKAYTLDYFTVDGHNYLGVEHQ